MGSGQAMTARVFAGIGCRRDCAADDILAVVRAAGRAVDALAAPAFKAGEAGLHAAADALGVPLIFVEPAALAAVQPLCVTRSAPAERATGVASVAEGCALAAAGPGGRLVLARITGARATCALAEAVA
jgi:cobalt-precorrin 5A hydrolase